MKNERRQILKSADFSVRAETEGDKRYLSGYAAVFNQRSKLIFERGQVFYEVIERNAFDKVLADENLNCVMTFNHERNKILGRNSSGTLELKPDERGLHFRNEVPNTTLGNDTFEMVQRGDFYECSFVFTVAEEGQSWSRTDEGDNLRTIHEISGLYDVAVCAINGAYATTEIDTEVAQRALDGLNLIVGTGTFIVDEDGSQRFSDNTVPEGVYSMSFDTPDGEMRGTMTVTETHESFSTSEHISSGSYTYTVTTDDEIEEDKNEAEEEEKFRADLDLKKMKIKLLEIT